MSRGVRRIAVGVGFALALALSTAPSAQAAPAGRDARQAHVVRTGRSLQAAQDPGLFGRLVSFVASVIGGDPRGPQLTQGPTVDPNGLH